MINTLRTYMLWAIYSVGSLLLCIWLAWQLCAQVNFMYPVWYSLLKIDQTIDQTMPKHLYKKEFIATDSNEHHRLFSEIVSSIQTHGKGLDAIFFYTPGGEKLGKLLTESEVTHLQDVADLIDFLSWVALAVFIFCLIILAAMILLRVHMPALKHLSYLVLTSIGLLATTIVLLGAKKFFYWLHTVIFPSEHQWFFYYEESLMSTLMKAPDLFAPISIMLVMVAVIIWLLHLLLLSKFAGFKKV